MIPEFVRYSLPALKSACELLDLYFLFLFLNTQLLWKAMVGVTRCHLGFAGG